LVSFLFNVGTGGIIKSGVQKTLNSGDYAGVPAKMQEWCKALDPKDGVKKGRKNSSGLSNYYISN
jgi:GH24 family phage-related lysozyme (muramidase)